MGENRIPYLLDEDKENYVTLIETIREDLIKCIDEELLSVHEEIERKNLLDVEQLVEYNKEKLTNLQQRLTARIIRSV